MDDLLAKFRIPDEPQREEELFAQAVASGMYRSHIVRCDECEFSTSGIVARGREYLMEACPLCGGSTSFVLTD